MGAQQITTYARSLYEAHGDEAEAEAAQKAREHEQAGETEQAEQWRSVRAAIRAMRGANES